MNGVFQPWREKVCSTFVTRRLLGLYFVTNQLKIRLGGIVRGQCPGVGLTLCVQVDCDQLFY